MTEPEPLTRPTAKTSFIRRRWVQIAGAALAGLLIGGATGNSTASTAQKEAKDAKARVAAAEDSAKSAQADAQRAQSEAASAQSAAASAKEDALRDAQAVLAGKSKSLDVRAAMLDEREKQIGGAEKTAQAGTFAGEGTYLVGTDIQPGTYRAAASPSCYYARLRSLNSTDIIDNANADGPVVVMIKASDKAFTANRCGEFHKIG